MLFRVSGTDQPMEPDRGGAHKGPWLIWNGKKNDSFFMHSTMLLSSQGVEGQLPPSERKAVLPDTSSRSAGHSERPQLTLVKSSGPTSLPERTRLILENRDLVRIIAICLHESLCGYRASVDEFISCGTGGLIEAVDSYDASRGVTFRSYAKHRIRGAILDSCSDWYRQTGHERPMEQLPVKHQPTVESTAKRLEIRQAVKTLSIREQLVCWMYYDDGYTMEEIAAKLSITKARVSQIHKKAIAALRETFAS